VGCIAWWPRKAHLGCTFVPPTQLSATSEAADLVRVFHETFGGQIFERTAAVRELRARLTREEAREAIEAILSGDLEATAKELADQVYVAHGTALALGIDLDAAVRAVHESNMTKLVDGEPVMRPDGKVLKGPNYQEPDMSHCVLDKERSIQ
jgi:predicted HAD superfamily Cof-like phosphohydrolase